MGAGVQAQSNLHSSDVYQGGYYVAPRNALLTVKYRY